MGKVLPSDWQVVLSGTMPELAGGGDRAAALRTLDYAPAAQARRSLAGDRPGAGLHADRRFPRALGLLDGALAGATRQIDRRTALYYRGHANFNLGHYAAGGRRFRRARSAGRTTLKARLAAAAVALRRPGPRQAATRARVLAKDIGNENLYEWPGPIAKFLLGKLPAGELEVAAESDDAAKRSNGKCPAAFFIGMDAHAPRRQAARARAAPARPGALPDRVRTQLGGVERAEAALVDPCGRSRSQSHESESPGASRGDGPMPMPSASECHLSRVVSPHAPLAIACRDFP